MEKLKVYISFFILMACNIILFLIKDFLPLFGFGVLTTAVVFHIGSDHLKERLIWVARLSAVILVINLVFRSGGLENRLLMSAISVARIYAISMTVLVFAKKISIASLLSAFDFLPKSYSLASVIAYGMIPVLFSEAKKIMIIQSSRGHSFSKLNPITSYLPLIVPLIHRTIRRSLAIATVVISRGFRL